MRNYLKILVGFVVVLIRVGEARAQLDNAAFTSPSPGYHSVFLTPVDGTAAELKKYRLERDSIK